ncbi:MAG: hypothetical protein LUQ40_06580 [Methanomicrobiales archaeon]|nr:hypothetical protein [Methanomicrobiales archaeon]
MDKSRLFAILGALILTVVATLWLYAVQSEFVFAGYILIILMIILLMSFSIMRETKGYPDVVCRLREDAKGLILVNRGNASAEKIHIALVPLNLEFDIPALAPDDEHEIALPSMVSEAKAVVNFENAQGGKYMRTYTLSALGSNEKDLLKPMIPIFGWKENEKR